MTAEQKSSNLKWWVLITVIIGTFLGRLDQTIVNLALPKIINDFGITVSAAGWIATAYILANAIFVPIWGKLGDTIGRKLVYIIGFIVFIVGSVLCGLSWNLGSMIVFRVIQAIASSADYPTAMAIIAVTFPGTRERAQALGLWSSSFAAASVFGPLIGGPLIDYFGWRSVFLVNLPVGLLGLYMAIRYINESVSAKRSVKFDWWGAVCLGAALSSLVLVLDKGLDWGWLSVNSLLCYFSTLAFTAIFIRIEHYHSEPIVDLKFFKNSVFVNTLINNFVVFMGMMGAMFLVPVFVQTFLGYDATHTGLIFMPMAFAMVIASAIGGRLVGKIQPRWIIMASTIGAGIGTYFFSWLDARSGIIDVMIPMTVMAFCLGFGMSQRTSIIATVVPKNEIGVASSVLALARNVAGAFGIAIFGTILTNRINTNVLNLAKNSTLHSHDPIMIKEFISLIALKAQILAYSYVYQIAAIVVIIGGLLAYNIKIKKEEKMEEVMILD